MFMHTITPSLKCVGSVKYKILLLEIAREFAQHIYQAIVQTSKYK